MRAGGWVCAPGSSAENICPGPVVRHRLRPGGSVARFALLRALRYSGHSGKFVARHRSDLGGPCGRQASASSVSLLIAINSFRRGDHGQVSEPANGQGNGSGPGHSAETSGSRHSGTPASDTPGGIPAASPQAGGSNGGTPGSNGGNAAGGGTGAIPNLTALNTAAPDGNGRVRSTHYKWLTLVNTTLGMLAATVNASIVIISLPAIFRGIKLNPLTAGNISYLLWMLMGYLVVSAVLVVTLGRLGDIYGRVKMYNAGFAIFALGALFLPFDPLTGPSGALWLIGFRVIQAFGGAMLMANAPAILTDAFPANQRGTAMGINQVAGISGMFIGLILGGVLAAIDWRLVFIVSVPIGIGGAIWSYLSLREEGIR